MAGTISIRDPRATAPKVREGSLPTLTDVRGRTVAILSNGWTSMDKFGNHLAALLKSRYGVADALRVSIPIGNAANPTVLDSVKEKADFAIVGLAN